MLTTSLRALQHRRISRILTSTQTLRVISTTKVDDIEKDVAERADIVQRCDLAKDSNKKKLTNEQILKIANIDLVSKKEAAIMVREKKIMTVYAFAGLAMSLFGLSLGATVFLSI
jgi:hypothetical protein